MPNAVATPRSAPVVMQGIAVPEAVVDPREFARLTRRAVVPQARRAFAGLGSVDNIKILEAGILAGIHIKLAGTITSTPGAGSVASTARFPYDLLRACRFSANGMANLVNCSGAKLKLREIMGRGDLSDRGVERGIGGASPGTTRRQGTLSQNSETWGIGSNVTAIAGGAYDYELTWFVPVSFDYVSLMGAIFAQTSSTDLNLELQWATAAEAFTLAGGGAVAVTGTLTVEAVTYSIPQAGNGAIIIPDLSAFHQFYETRVSGIGNGGNEVRLAGQGIGRQLLRVAGQVFNGNPGVPLPVTPANYGQFSWRFGGNDQPEIYADASMMRTINEKTFNADVGALHGFWVYDWASEHAFRDSIDEGSASELRIAFDIASGVALSGAAVEYVQETMVAGASGS